ncbi:MAG: hypothetical protein JWO78_2061 [Micavibrio sp.]|nr:hypothetical protein [Micavibrio sp.]
MNFSSEKIAQDLRRGIRGSLNFHSDEDVWNVKHVCVIYGLSHEDKKYPDKRETGKKGRLGADLHEENLASEFNARKSSETPEHCPSRRLAGEFKKVEHYIAALDPQYHEYIYCRPEVTMALSVVALEKGLDAKTVRAIVPDIRKQLKDAACVTAMQGRFPDITDKRVIKAVKELKL